MSQQKKVIAIEMNRLSLTVTKVKNPLVCCSSLPEDDIPHAEEYKMFSNQPVPPAVDYIGIFFRFSYLGRNNQCRNFEAGLCRINSAHRKEVQEADIHTRATPASEQCKTTWTPSTRSAFWSPSKSLIFPSIDTKSTRTHQIDHHEQIRPRSHLHLHPKRLRLRLRASPFHSPSSQNETSSPIQPTALEPPTLLSPIITVPPWPPFPKYYASSSTIQSNKALNPQSPKAPNPQLPQKPQVASKRIKAHSTHNACEVAQ